MAKENSKRFIIHKGCILPSGRTVYLGQRDQEPGLLRQQADTYCAGSETGH